MRTLFPPAWLLVLLLLLAFGPASAQNASAPLPSAKGLPITITVFAESVSLPRLQTLLQGGLGVQVGTELYYRQRTGSQLFQTAQVGYYHHPRLHSGLSVSSSFGYRKFLGNFYSEALVGAGALALSSPYPSYKPDGSGGYQKAPAYLLRLMPTASIGAGYRFASQAAVFTRYEVFGEWPFSQLVLPHQAIHVGTRFLLPR